MLLMAIVFLVINFPTMTYGKNKDDKSWEREPLKLEVVLQTQFIDGNMVEEAKEETVWSLADFWANYADWKVMSQEEGKVVFRKKVNDISPAVKQNGYFGIDDNNVLSIFNGKPENKQVIKAFYQIDVGKLESYRMDQLKQGIKVDKRDTFETVMETYKEFASSEPVND